MKNKLENHKGRFISLSWKEGKETKKASCKLIRVTPKTVTFQDVNSWEVKTKMISSLV